MARDSELDRLKAEQDNAFQRKQSAWQAQDQAWNRRAAARESMDRAYHEKQRAHEAQEASWQDYQRVRSYAGPRIDHLNSAQESAFENMKAAFSRASAAHESRDGASARMYADEGHRYKAEAQEAVAERRRLVQEIREARARHDATKPAFQAAKAEFDRAKLRHGEAKAEHDRARAAFQRAKADFDRVHGQYESRRKVVQNHREQRKNDNRSLAIRAGVPHHHADDVVVSTDPDGTVNVYFGGLGAPDGPGHGHYAMDSSHHVTYRREPHDPHGSQNFTDHEQRRGQRYDWSDRGVNKGLFAGSKRDPSGDGPGQWWARSDGTSGQDQSRTNPDGSVTYWHHDRANGQEIITEVVYGPDGTEWSRVQRRKH